MSFDPTLPINGSGVSSAELRGQLNALKALNDALTATVAAQAAQIAAQDIAISQRIKSSDAMAVFAASVAGLAGDSTTFDDPPTQGQIESLRDKVNELIGRLQTL